MTIKTISIIAFVIGVVHFSVMAQTYDKFDSGWVSLFNGVDLDGFYVVSDAKLKNPAQQNLFSVSNNEIHTGGGYGYLATKKEFQNYQVRAEYKFGSSSNGRNAGLLYHIPTADYNEAYAFESSPPVNRLGTWPTCIEFQMYNGGGPSGQDGVGPHAGAFLGINNVWAKSIVNRPMSCAYDVNGEAYDVILGGLYCARRVGPVVRGTLNDYEEWVSLQLDAFGDSVTHFINGDLAAKVWNIEYTDLSSPSRSPMTGGHIGFQSEGANISYRNFEIRMLDDEGVPIIPGCTDSSASNFVPFATEDDSSCVSVALGDSFKRNGFSLSSKVSGQHLIVKYELPRSAPVALLEVLDLQGYLYGRVKLNQKSGTLSLKRSDFTSGVLVIKLTSGNFSKAYKVSILNI